MKKLPDGIRVVSSFAPQKKENVADGVFTLFCSLLNI